jgi:hypothetical protein
LKRSQNAVGLRMLRLGPGVFDAFERQVELKRMPVGRPAVFRAAVRQDARDRQPVVGEKWQHAIVQEVGGGHGRFVGVELREAHLRIGIDERLQIDPPDALQRAHVEGVLRPAVARTLAFELTVRLLLPLTFLKRCNLGLGQYAPSCATFASSTPSRFFIVYK